MEPKNQCGNIDMVNHPPHYNTGMFEVIDILKDKLGNDGFESYCIGNTLKYLMRYEHKGNPLQDLRKARWYLDRVIQQYEKEVANDESKQS